MDINLNNNMITGLSGGFKEDTTPKSQYFVSVGNAPVKITNEFITGSTELPGYEIVRSLGIAKGITVRSRNLCSTIFAILCSFGGGRNMIFCELCEQARDEALQLLVQQAQKMGANAVICMRYESHDIADGITEVLAYGTAVQIKVKN